MARTRATYIPSERTQLMDRYRAERSIAAQAQQDASLARATNGLATQRASLRAQGVWDGNLPTVTSRMSPTDMAAAQAKLNGGAFAGLPFRPAAPQGLTTDEGRALVDLRRQQLGLPTTDALAQGVKVAAAAGTGAPVATPYGTVSSRSVKAGSIEAPAVVTDTGVQRQPLNWQQQIAQAYPAIAQAGTSANLAFVKAYKAAQAGGPDMETDPLKIAHSVMNPAKQDLTAPGGALAVNPLPTGIAAPLMPGQSAPVSFAGFDVPPSTTGAIPATAAQTAGANARTFAGGFMDAALAQPKAAASAVMGGIRSGVGAVGDFFKGITTASPTADPAGTNLPMTVPTPSSTGGSPLDMLADFRRNPADAIYDKRKLWNGASYGQ